MIYYQQKILKKIKNKLKLYVKNIPSTTNFIEWGSVKLESGKHSYSY